MLAAWSGASETRYWASGEADLWRGKDQEVTGYVETRTPGLYQQFSARWERGWPGANLTFIRTEPYDQVRFELEAEPERMLASWLRVRGRSRYELRWFDGEGWDHHRLRQRVELAASYKGFFAAMSDEVLFETDPGAFSENRWVPLGVGLRHEKGWASLYYMRRSRRSGLEHVLGTAVTLRR